MISRQAKGLRRVPTHMPPHLIEALDKLAGMEGVSRSGMIVKLVREGLNKAQRRQAAQTQQ